VFFFLKELKRQMPTCQLDNVEMTAWFDVLGKETCACPFLPLLALYLAAGAYISSGKSPTPLPQSEFGLYPTMVYTAFRIYF
jgi:hypothetical protein